MSCLTRWIREQMSCCRAVLALVIEGRLHILKLAAEQQHGSGMSRYKSTCIGMGLDGYIGMKPINEKNVTTETPGRGFERSAKIQTWRFEFRIK